MASLGVRVGGRIGPWGTKCDTRDNAHPHGDTQMLLKPVEGSAVGTKTLINSQALCKRTFSSGPQRGHGANPVSQFQVPFLQTQLRLGIKLPGQKTHHLSNASSLGLQMALPSCCTLSLMERRFSPGVNCINICHCSGISAYNDEKYVRRMRGALSITSLPMKRN